jgi:ADP-ribose pyrophosphatase
MSYTPQFDQGDISLENDTLAYDGFFKMRALQLSHRRFDGSQSKVFERELCVRGDAVGILLYDPALAKFALVEQIRIGAIERPQSPWLLEIVAGMLDKAGEDKQQLARRESFEEAGLQVGLIEPMLEYFCSPGGSTEFFSLFCGQVDLRDVAADNFGVDDENEDIRLHILDVSEALTLLRQGVINNAMTIIALQWFQLHRQQLDAAWLP